MIHTRIRRVLQGSDYSAQEPRLLSQLCADEGMLRAYEEGKDLYVEIAAISFNRPYKICLEHFPKGCPIKEIRPDVWVYAKLKTGEDDCINNFEDLGRYLEPDFDPNQYDYDKLADGDTDTFYEGKEYRSQAKKILLGIMYGRGEKSIAEQLFGMTDDKEQNAKNLAKAKAIKDKVYTAFPRIKVFEDESNKMVREKGYVTTLWGRKRRLANFNLPKYAFQYVDEKGKVIKNMPVPKTVQDSFIEKYSKIAWNKRDEFIKKLYDEEHIQFIDNSSRIAAASRQIINSRVQGSASDMSKLAMIKILNDEELKKRGVKLILPIHDEIIIEAPLRYARYTKDRFAHDMMTAAKPKLTIPVSCDVVNSVNWTGHEVDLDAELKDVE